MKTEKESKLKIHVSDIEWDTDGEDVNLPEEIIISNPTMEMLDDIDGYADAIADYLSDEYGFCVNNFNAEVVKPKIKNVDFSNYFKNEGYSVILQENMTKNPKMPTYMVLAYGKQCKAMPEGEYVTWMVNKRPGEKEFSRNWGHYFSTGSISKEEALKKAMKDFHDCIKEARENAR